MKINKKGITLVELIVSFTLVSVAVIYFYQTLYTVKKIYVDARDHTNSFVEKSYKFKLAYNEAKNCSGQSAGIREYDVKNYGTLYGTLYYYCSDNTVKQYYGAYGEDGGSSGDFNTDSSLDNYFEVSKITDIDFSSDEHKTKSIENDEEIFTIINNNNNNNGFVYENDKNYLTVLGNGNKNFQRLIFYKYSITDNNVGHIKVEASSTYPEENGYKGGENNPISLCEVAILDPNEKRIATTYFGGGTKELNYEITSGKKFGYILLAHRSDKNYANSKIYSCNLKVLKIIWKSNNSKN